MKKSIFSNLPISEQRVPTLRTLCLQAISERTPAELEQLPAELREEREIREHMHYFRK